MEPPNNDSSTIRHIQKTPSGAENSGKRTAIKVALFCIFSATIIVSGVLGMDPHGQALFLIGSVKITMPFVAVTAMGSISCGFLILYLVDAKKPRKEKTVRQSEEPIPNNISSSTTQSPSSQLETTSATQSPSSQLETTLWTTLLESMQKIKPLVEKPGGEEELAQSVKNLCLDMENLLTPGGFLDKCKDLDQENQLIGQVRQFGDYLLNALGEKKFSVLNYLISKPHILLGPVSIYILSKEKILNSENILMVLNRLPSSFGILAAHFMREDEEMLCKMIEYLSTEMCLLNLRMWREHWKFVLQNLFERLPLEKRDKLLPRGFKFVKDSSENICIEPITLTQTVPIF